MAQVACGAGREKLGLHHTLPVATRVPHRGEYSRRHSYETSVPTTKGEILLGRSVQKGSSSWEGGQCRLCNVGGAREEYTWLNKSPIMSG